MNVRLLSFFNRPAFAGLRLGGLLLFVAAVVLAGFLFINSLSGNFTLADFFRSSDDKNSKKAFIGVINGQGQWVIKPKYLQIIYMRKTDTFWVKVRQSSDSFAWLPDYLRPALRNTAWKLLDRNGVELVSHLSYLTDPVCAEMVDFGASVHPDRLVVRTDRWEYGYCEPDGRPITGCKYSLIKDVGHDTIIAVETKKDLGDSPMPLVVLDGKGKKLRTLDETVYPNYCNSYGQVQCQRRGQSGYVDYRGEFIPLAVNQHPPNLGAKNLYGQPVVFRNLASFPKSDAESVEWVDVVKKPQMRNYVFAIDFIDDRAVVGATDPMATTTSGTNSGANSVPNIATKYGLVDITGNWLIKPVFRGLLYCSKDRLIAHNKERTPDAINIERCEHMGSLNGCP
jgi:hypothetical protein